MATMTSSFLEDNLNGENSSWLDAFSALDPKTFLSNFLVQNTRPDGRLLYQCRPTFLSRGVITRNAAGSALVKLGDTQVLAAVTLLIGQPTSINTSHTTTDESATTSREEGGHASSNSSGGSGDVVVTVSCGGNNNNNSSYTDASGRIQTILQESGMIDFHSLLIVPKKAAWRLNISCQVLNDDGNVYDAALLASIAALTDTKLPSTKEEQDGMIYIVGEQQNTTTANDKDPAESSTSSRRLQIIPHNIPIPLTIALYEIEQPPPRSNNNDGNNDNDDMAVEENDNKTTHTIMLADPTTLEQTHQQSSLTVVVVGGGVTSTTSSSTTVKPKILNVRLSGNIRIKASHELSVATHMAFGRSKELMSLLQ